MMKCYVADARKKTGISLQFWLKCFLVFLFLFEVNCSAWGLPTFITTRRLAIAIMAVCVCLTGKLKIVISKRQPYGSFHRVFWLYCFLLCYSLLLLLFVGRGQGEHIALSITRFMYIGIFGALVFEQFFKDLEELLSCLIVASLVQSIIILLFIVAPSFQSAADTFVGQAAECADLRRRGYYTGLSCATSFGTLKLAPSMAACLYFVLNRQRGIRTYVAAFVLISLSACIIARTSLIFVMLTILLMLIFSGKIAKKRLWRIIGIFISFVILSALVIYFFDLFGKLSELFQRYVELRERGGVLAWLINGYLGRSETARTVIPKISWATIVGIGISSGISGNGVAVNVDGGYLRMYAAVGLPLAIIYYLRMLFITYSPIKVISELDFKSVMIFMFAYLFVGEFKEYFLTGGYAINLFYSMLMLHEKSKEPEKRTGRSNSH